MAKDYALNDLGEMLVKPAEDFSGYREEFSGFCGEVSSFRSEVNNQMGNMMGDIHTIKITLPPLSSLVAEMPKDILELKRRIENLEKKARV